MKRTLFSILLLVSTGVASARAADADAPYRVTVWADVQFDLEGAAASVEVIDADRHPPGFIEQLRQRFARARITPVTAGGAPATFRSGVAIDLTITPAGESGSGGVAVDGLRIEPLPRRARLGRYRGEHPDPEGGGWDGEVRATCAVDIEGRCSTITVEPVPGLPEDARRFARETLKQWRYDPQQVNGVPIPSVAPVRFTLEAPAKRPDDFRLKGL
jgi:hypothetical protein